MNTITKLVRFFLSSPSEARYEDVERVLIAFGFKEKKSKGSHHIFRHEDGRMQTVPKKGGQKVKGFYIKQTVKLLRLEDWYVQQEED